VNEGRDREVTVRKIDFAIGLEKIKILSQSILGNHVIVRARGCISLQRQQLSFDRGRSYIGCYCKSIRRYTIWADRQGAISPNRESRYGICVDDFWQQPETRVIRITSVGSVQ
jgi:hypothetical protein